MSVRNPNGSPQPLDEKLLEQLSQSVEPIRKDEAIIYRGRERLSIISFLAPARGRFTRHAMRILGDCAQNLGSNHRFPGALEAKRGALPGFVLFKPVTVYNEHAPDQYPIKWSRGFKQAHIDLLPIFQPMNLQVPRGYAAEMPLSMVNLPNRAGWTLLLHVGEARVRAIKEIPKSEEEEFTNTDEDLKDQGQNAPPAKAKSAPGQQK